ncbi:MAG: hypothetical protein ACAI38_19775 [Myxococcota bacterium]
MCAIVVGLLVGCGDPENAPPLASATCGAGTNCLVLPNGDATLDARGSSDVDGDALAFRWYPVDSASLCVNPTDCPCGWTNQEFTGFIRDTGSAMTTFRASSTVGAQLIFQVEVSDTEHVAKDCSIYFVAEF